MKFDDLDDKMRVYEKALDQCIVPGMYMIARLDGRSFTRLTKEICKFEAPFDDKFRDMMVETVKYLMKDSGFQIVYGYTESDEISLLFKKDATTFNRKVRKLNSVLAGMASAFFSLKVGLPVCFDCRIIALPNLELLEDYFSWRMEDAHRNSLNSWCYWTLRKEGISGSNAQSMMMGKNTSYKNELLFQRGINYNELPSWQRRGISVYWKEYTKDGWNPKTKETVQTTRRTLEVDMELPLNGIPNLPIH